MQILRWIKLVSFITVLVLPIQMSYAACSCGDGGDNSRIDQTRRNNTEDPD